jgi:hypothetical protein
MRGRRLPLVEVGVAVAAALSAVLLMGMLASPLIPSPTPSPLPTVAVPTSTPAVESVPVPMGLYQARGPISSGPCFAIELTPESYAVRADQGVATVSYWERGMTGCDARSGDVATVDAAVEPVLAEGGESSGEVTAYSVEFRHPLSDGSEIVTEIALLMPERSNPTLLQAVETSSPGVPGIVLDLVTAVDPSLNPLPSQPS